MDKYKLRLIKNSEIKKAALVVADSFKDYPLYKYIFGSDKSSFKKLYRFYVYSIYSRRRYVYVNNELTIVGCFNHNNAKKDNVFRCLLHLPILFCILPMLKVKYIKIQNELANISNPIRDTLYNKDKDLFLEFICIKEDERKDISFFELFKHIYNGESIYIETADSNLVTLYNMLGFVEKTTIEYNGVINHCLYLTKDSKKDIKL